MKTSKDAVQPRLNKMAKELGVSVNVLIAAYFFDAFLARLSKSGYSENFVLKGGFYLSMVAGINNRYTKDLDFKLTGRELSEENLSAIVGKIIAVDVGDNIYFELGSLSRIRESDKYGGYSVSITGHLENIRQAVSLDIATGDPVTPGIVWYEYKRLLDGSSLFLPAYNLETVLAEKIQTMLGRGLLNSRSKDFYDIYIIGKLKWQDISVPSLKLAFEKTCEYRNCSFSKTETQELLSRLKSDTLQLSHWENYARKNTFAKDIEFAQIMEVCGEVINEIFK